MNFLVTGGAGFIGGAIANRLVKMGHSVWIIDNLKSGYITNIPSGAVFIEGDFSKNDILAKLDGVRFDGVFHIGGQSSGEISFEDPEYDLNTNTLSTIKLLQYCVRTNCKKIVYASTMSVYGERNNQEQFSESDEANPKSFYAVGKLASERYLSIFSKQYDIKYVALRYFNVYGPGQNLENLKQGMVSIYLKQFLDEDFDKVVVKGSLNRFRDLVYIGDVVNVTIDSMEKQIYDNQILNVGTGIKTTVMEVLSLIKKYTNSDKEIEIHQGTPGDQFGIFADNKKLISLYNRPFLKFEDGLKKMIDWAVKNK